MRRSAGLFGARPDRDELLRAATLLGGSGPTVVHAFEPHGDSVAVLGEACRVVLHTWPEHRLVTVDVYAPSPISLEPLVSALGWIPVAEPTPREHPVQVSDPGVSE